MRQSCSAHFIDVCTVYKDGRKKQCAQVWMSSFSLCLSGLLYSQGQYPLDVLSGRIYIWLSFPSNMEHIYVGGAPVPADSFRLLLSSFFIALFSLTFSLTLRLTVGLLERWGKKKEKKKHLGCSAASETHRPPAPWKTIRAKGGEMWAENSQTRQGANRLQIPPTKNKEIPEKIRAGPQSATPAPPSHTGPLLTRRPRQIVAKENAEFWRQCLLHGTQRSTFAKQPGILRWGHQLGDDHHLVWGREHLSSRDSWVSGVKNFTPGRAIGIVPLMSQFWY